MSLSLWFIKCSISISALICQCYLPFASLSLWFIKCSIYLSALIWHCYLPFVSLSLWFIKCSIYLSALICHCYLVFVFLYLRFIKCCIYLSALICQCYPVFGSFLFGSSDAPSLFLYVCYFCLGLSLFVRHASLASKSRREKKKKKKISFPQNRLNETTTTKFSKRITAKDFLNIFIFNVQY